MKLLDLLEETKNEVQRQVQEKKARNVFSFLKKGKIKKVVESGNDKTDVIPHVYEYELSDDFDVEVIKSIGISENGESYTVYRPKIRCDVNVIDTNREDVHKIQPFIVNQQLSKLFERNGIKLTIKDFHGDADWTTRDNFLQENEDKKINIQKKKASNVFEFLKTGTITVEQKHKLPSHYVMVKHTYEYTLSNFNVIISKPTDIPFIACNVMVKDTNETPIKISHYTIQGHLTKLFKKHRLELVVYNFTGDVEVIRPAKPMDW